MNTLRDEKTGKTVLIVHHDLSKVPNYFDPSCLSNREVTAFGPTKETTQANQSLRNRLFSMEVTYDCRYRWIAKIILTKCLDSSYCYRGRSWRAVGCFIILRGMSLIRRYISHAVLPGVALSFILSIDFFIRPLSLHQKLSRSCRLWRSIFLSPLGIILISVAKVQLTFSISFLVIFLLFWYRYVYYYGCRGSHSLVNLDFLQTLPW